MGWMSRVMGTPHRPLPYRSGGRYRGQLRGFAAGCANIQVGRDAQEAFSPNRLYSSHPDHNRMFSATVVSLADELKADVES